MMWILFLPMAFAQEVEAPPEEPSDDGPIVIPTTDEVLPSATDDVQPITYDDDDDWVLGMLGDFSEDARPVFGASTFFRPVISLLVAPDANPLQLGVTGGRRWWLLRRGLGVSGSVQGSADLAVAGGAGSYDLEIAALGGPQLHLASIQIGPALGASRFALGEDTLQSTGTVDVWALLTLDLEVVQLFGGAAPRWLLSDNRPGATSVPVGDELAVRAGLGVAPGKIRLAADWTRRWTAIGPIDRIGFGLRFSVL